MPRKIQTRYFLVSDGDGHWYVVPATHREQWDDWIDSEDYINGIDPEFATPVDGPSSVTFVDPVVP